MPSVFQIEICILNVTLYYNCTHICFIFVDVFKSGIWSTFNTIRDPELVRLAKHLPATVLQSRQEGTVRVYNSAFQRWKRWADQYEEVTHLPADPRYISLYLLSLYQTARTHNPITSALYAISWAHKMAGLSDPTTSRLPQMVREASLRTLGQGHNSKEPLTVEMLKLLIDKHLINPDNLLNARLNAMCCLAFVAFMRFDELSKLKRSDIVFHETYMAVFVEKAKNDVYRIGHWVLVARTGTVYCPVGLLDRYLKLSGMQDLSDKFIFRAVSYSVKRKVHTLKSANSHLSYTRTREVMLQAFREIGLDSAKFGTHSLRKGGITQAALNSVPDRLLKKHGRWVSDRSKDKYISEDIKQKLSVTLNLGL